MNAASTDWLSAIGILLSGFVLGFMFIYASMRRKSAASAAAAAATPTLELLDLQARRDSLIAQLREMDDEGITAGEERRKLEMQTADVLRSIDALQSVRQQGVFAAAAPSTGVLAADATPSHATGFFVKHPEVKGFLWGVASIAALALIGVYVYRSASDKPAAGAAVVPGSTAVAQGQPPAGAATTDPVVRQLEQAVSADPDNVDRRIELARAYLDHENMMGVFEQTKAVLAKHPDEPRAQTYSAIVKMAMGQIDEADTLLTTATRTDPKLVDAWVALAWIHMQKGQKPAAQSAIQKAIAASPQNQARLEEVWAQMQAQPPAAPAGGAANPHLQGDAAMGDLPVDHPSMTEPGPTAVPSVAAVDPSSAIHLTLTLDKAARSRSGIVYVIARAAGQSSGMPLAVKRINASTFPMTLDLSSADSMLGQPLPSRVSIEARLDADGDAMTKSPSDPHAYAESVSSGIKLAMTLK